MSTPAPIGTINPCGSAALYDRTGRVVATCPDTPNAVQVAFETCPKAVRVNGENHTGPRRKFTGRCLSDDQRTALRRSIRVF